MNYSKEASAEELLIRNKVAKQKAASFFLFRLAVIKSRKRTELASLRLLVVFLFCSHLTLNEIAPLLPTKLHLSLYFVSAVLFRRML